MKANRIYGYARVSTMKQSIQRQIDNIKSIYPDAVIVAESYTGTTMNRPEWNKLEKQLHDGDTVVFDEVSRMARNAEEGFKTYKNLFDRGVNLIFLKESTLNTENFKNVQQVAMTGTEVDAILKGVNEYLMLLAQNQIKAAFGTAEHEVTFLRKRTSEGVRRAQAEGKIVGRKEGATIETKKALASKAVILKHSKSFGGSLSDAECIKQAGISRNSFYKYKRELQQETPLA